MGDSLQLYHSRTSMDPRVITSKKLAKNYLVASAPKSFSQKTIKCITSMKEGILGGGGDIVLFLLTTAALEVVRRFSRARCPFVWHGLQTLQVLCYPPFKWIQRWAPFKSLVKHTQKLSRPMLVLTIATVFSDQSACTTLNNLDDSQVYSESQSEPSSQLATPDTRSHNKAPKSLSSERWLLELHKELEKLGITLPERIDDDELRRFYAAANGDFSRLLSSVKKTVRWRQTYTILSPQELEAWSHFVFWHGCDVELHPCLIIRLGIACSNLRPNDRSLFVKAIVSQIEHGVMNLLHKEHSQITVLMDCEGLSPFGFPMQMMRSCAMLLQDHYPNRLGCLIVIRLPPVARVITQTLFQILRPNTRQKLRIIGWKYQEILSEYLQTRPRFLGGNCSCPKCCDTINLQNTSKDIIQKSPSADLTKDENVTSPNFHNSSESMNVNKEQVIRTAIIGVVMLWIFIAFILSRH